jgi:uncharacterized membrane protein YbaN (DUF454 family)
MEGANRQELRRYGRVPARAVFACAGLGFVGLGTIGMFVPLMPTTVFYILALWCFKRSSARLEGWLLRNRYVGKTLRDWDESRSLTARTKAVAVAAIWVVIGISAILVSSWGARGMLAVVAVSLTAYLLTRKTTPISA